VAAIVVALLSKNVQPKVWYGRLNVIYVIASRERMINECEQKTHVTEYLFIGVGQHALYKCSPLRTDEFTVLIEIPVTKNLLRDVIASRSQDRLRHIYI
jgi:hypothetical protein